MAADVLVVGSGIAGLSYAYKVAREWQDRRIIVLTKSSTGESNTRYAQGGIAGVLDSINDSFGKHILDTLTAGDGLCNPHVVELVVKEGPERIRELLEWGAAFDCDGSGAVHLGREGGHSVNRIVHVKDQTGFAVQSALMKALEECPNVDICSDCFATDLLLDKQGRCGGVNLLCPTGEEGTIISPITVLATGGAGQVYASTTNPLVATGDGIAMAARARAEMADMEFVQFHPTALYQPGANPTFLISEAVRGFGAELRNMQGEAFMEKYDARGSLATRDIVSRAIYAEMQRFGSKHVYLDLRHLDVEQFAKGFPVIYAKCISLGLDLKNDMVPVAPAAHYLCGGVQVDEHGQTSVPNLFCIGESACTGLHGANRLASNSLLEALVFAHRAYLKTVSGNFEAAEIVQQSMKAGMNQANVDKIKRELGQLMSRHAGIVRNERGLENAKKQIAALKQTGTDGTVAGWETRNLLEVAGLIVEASLTRKENRGCFYKVG